MTGLIYKVLLANNISSLWHDVETIGVHGINVLSAWLGSWGFSFQIYFDFWGYSLMAIGLARIMNFRISHRISKNLTVHFQLQNSGEDGTLPSEDGSESICIFLWEETEKDLSDW